MNTNLEPQTSTSWPARIIAAVLFTTLSAVCVIGFLRFFPPKPYPNNPPPFAGYDSSKMLAALSPQSVGEELKAVSDLGTRFPGDPGYVKVQDLIRKQFQDAGLEILDQAVSFPSPRTVRREILGEDQKPLEGVEIYPYLPNHIQPIATPDQGVSGKLTLVTDELLLNGHGFAGCIALIDAEKPPSNLGFAWTRYAQMGFQAVIVADRGGLEKMDWTATTGMIGSSPINYPRLAANEKIFDHLDQFVTLHVRCRFESVESHTLIGIMHTGAKDSPAQSALVISSTYDAPSLLPDVAPGCINAISVATQLSTLKGLAAYKDQLKRDVIFVSSGSQFMDNIAVDRLIATIGPAIEPSRAKGELDTEIAANSATLAAVDEVSKIANDDKFLTDPAATASMMAGLSPNAARWMEDQFQYTMDSVLFELSEVSLQARLADTRNRMQFEHTTHEDDLFPAYQKANQDYEAASAASGYKADRLLVERKSFVDRYDLRSRFARRVDEALAFHKKRDADLAASVKIYEAFLKYQSVVVVTPYLAPMPKGGEKDEVVNYFQGLSAYGQNPDVNDPQCFAINDVVLSVSQRFPDIKAKYDGFKRNHNGVVGATVKSAPVDTLGWALVSRTAFAMVNTNRAAAYSLIGAPVDPPEMHDLSTIQGSLEFLGQTLLSLGFGNGQMPPPLDVQRSDRGGQVFASNIGKAIVPTYTLEGAVGAGHHPDALYHFPGYLRCPYFMTDMYGRYDFPFTYIDVMIQTYSPEAAVYDPAGRIIWMQDQGAGGSALQTAGQSSTGSNTNVVDFRCTPVTVLDMINPQTLKSYTGVGFLGRDTLADLARLNQWPGSDADMTFVEPDKRVYVVLKSGAPGNDLTNVIRAFMLGIDLNYKPTTNEEIEGNGFLAADTPFILDVPGQVARSMMLVNSKRIDLQNQFNMVDERTKDFHKRAGELLQRAQEPGNPDHTAIIEKRDAVTYTQINHPILRDSVSEAIVGVIYYLALLVPFVFFFEKLVFGYTDIRKQLLAQSIIFVVVFLLLRVLHPAFEMIRSPMMILLGFVILLISFGVTLLFSSKFGENLEEIRKQQGRVTGAQASTSGVVGTAFLLGLNNMHRRKVRTGLTCATLVLMTFAMICFAGVQTNIVSETSAVGKAAYQGLLVKREKFYPIDDNELFALQTKYDYKFTVAPRSMILGHQDWDRTRHNPGLWASYAEGDKPAKKIEDLSAIILSPNEPLSDKIHMLTKRGWFTKKLNEEKKETPPVMIPDTLAKDLNITPEMVDSSDVIVTVMSKKMWVQGIFDSTSLGNLHDLDSRDLLPFNIEAAHEDQVELLSLPTGQLALVADECPRIGADKILIASSSMGIAGERRTSIAVVMPNIGYKEAREQIDQYLEQSGQQASFGLAGVGYVGRRTRTGSFDGLFDMIIPLIIAGITVLNTMNGSVYERRDEIFVYNAVGIAPRYIFFMFIAEAFVYAVVGSILGYILSQATGKILTELHLTGGLNMTFTSYMTIVASALIMIAVFLSTILPGLTAMRIAAPSEDSGWKLPPADGDTMTFDLPFTFDWRERVAVLAFFNRFFLDHGEGSAGRFFAGAPATGVEQDPAQPDARDGTVPNVNVTVWLKPFDLGVSQKVHISMPRDEETGDYIARITLTRISGTRESWHRLTISFVGLLRRHFLHWRAVEPEQKSELFDEARNMLSTPEART